VVFTNRSSAKKAITYFDYWDVAWWLVRYDTPVTSASAYDAAHVVTSYDAARAAFTAVGDAAPGDPDVPSLVADPSPQSAWVAWLGGAPYRFDTVGSAFFGAGDRKLPDAVRAGSATNSVDASGALANDAALFVGEKGLSLEPGEERVIDVVYGIAPRGT